MHIAMRTVFSWVHLADLSDMGRRFDASWGSDAEASELVKKKLLQDVERLTHNWGKPQAIFLTGDLGEHGQQYGDVQEFLKTLTSQCSLGLQDVHVVPGNHDVVVPGDKSVRRLLRSLKQNEQESLDEALLDSTDRASLANRFKGFLDFARALGSGSELYWSKPVLGLPVSIRLIGINTALLFEGKEDGQLRVGNRQLSLIQSASEDIVIVLSHHPFDPVYVADAKAARAVTAMRAHIHLMSRSYGDEVIGTKDDVIHLAAGGRPTEEPTQTFVYHFASIVARDDQSLELHVVPRRWSFHKRTFVQDVDVLPGDGASTVLPIPIKPGRASSPGMLVGATTEGIDAPASPRKSLAETDVEYVSKFVLEGIRALRHVEWSVPPRPGWHVLIGDNGSGKTTFLRALAYALLTSKPPGEDRPYIDEASKLPCNVVGWVRDTGYLELWRQYERSERGSGCAALEMTISQSGPSHVSVSSEYDQVKTFTASFGPFRRFTGGDESEENTYASMPHVFRHLSLFKESVSFQETVQWLKDLRADELEDASKAFFLQQVKEFINAEGFLPNGVKLEEITAGTNGTITFVDSNRNRVQLDDLSDGFRSILSVALELLRQLTLHHGAERIFENGRVVAAGIVLIDEVDAHLHPTWQRQIGKTLRSLFPRIQFIVTTHSALVCQGAADGHGSIFRLPKPGVEDDDGQMLEGMELYRILYGDVLDAYGTEAFGSVQRSDEGQQMQERLAQLNLKELRRELLPEEKAEQKQLRAIFGL